MVVDFFSRRYHLNPKSKQSGLRSHNIPGLHQQLLLRGSRLSYTGHLRRPTATDHLSNKTKILVQSSLRVAGWVFE